MTDTTNRRPAAVSIGTFDGVHRGHEAVAQTLIAEAGARGLRPVAMTFADHPLAVIAPERVPDLIISPGQRDHLLRSLGLDVDILDFNAGMAALTAREWMTHLRRDLDTRLLIVGYDNTFGSDGLNLSIADFRAIGREIGMEVLEAPIVSGVSSSRIRKAVKSGDLEAAARMLGRPFTLSGTVAHGHAIGTSLGYPTANLNFSYRALLPADGVYAALAFPDDGDHPLPAIVNIGMKPTFANTDTTAVEAHILDFSDDLYDHTLRLQFVSRLRPEKCFDNPALLAEAIAADEAEARRVLQPFVAEPQPL